MRDDGCTGVEVIRNRDGKGWRSVDFAFEEDPGFEVSSVVVETMQPPRVVRLLRAGVRFLGKLRELPGKVRYRFRVLCRRPVRRDGGLVVTKLGWDFATSFDWGLATNW